MKIIVIGANAAGAKAAAKAKRLNPDADVTLIDRGVYFSYGTCGIPYYLSGLVPELDDLFKTASGVVRDPAFFKNVKGVRVVTQTEAVGIDREKREVVLYERPSGHSYTLSYDRLILATGSSAAIVPLETMGCPNIVTLKSIEDARSLKSKAVAGRSACIVGGGLIGLETAEALKIKGMHVTVVEMRDHLLPGVLDKDMSLLLERHLREKGVDVLTSCAVVGFDGTTRIELAITNHGEVPADVVILAPGVVPNITLAEECGLAIGDTGAIAVDDHMRTSDPDIFACGDCCESTHLVTGKQIYHPLGSIANKQARVAGINAAGGDARLTGTIGTIIVKVFDFTAARTGLTETEALDEGLHTETVLISAPDRAPFFPTVQPVTVKLIADRKSSRLLGAQAIGAGAADKRIDVAATAITFGAKAEQLAQLDLAYAPPYSMAVDHLLAGGHLLVSKFTGEAEGIAPLAVKQKMERKEEFILLDVRTAPEQNEVRIPGAVLLPLTMLRNEIAKLPAGKEIITFCKTGMRGFEASKILRHAGFYDAKFMDGGLLAWPFDLEVPQIPQ